MRRAAAGRSSGRGDQRARADRPAAGSSGGGAAPALVRDLPGLPDPGRRPASGKGRRDAVRATAARGGDRPEDLPGAVLRAVAGGLVGPVRADAQPRRTDERAAPRPGLLCRGPGHAAWRG